MDLPERLRQVENVGNPLNDFHRIKGLLGGSPERYTAMIL
jgi:hypothetical protein